MMTVSPTASGCKFTLKSTSVGQNSLFGPIGAAAARAVKGAGPNGSSQRFEGAVQLNYCSGSAPTKRISAARCSDYAVLGALIRGRAVDEIGQTMSTTTNCRFPATFSTMVRIERRQVEPAIGGRRPAPN